MLTILIAGCRQEVSTFNPWPSGYEDFHVSTGQAILSRNRGRRTSIGGALEVLEARGDCRLVPAFDAGACSAGVLKAADFKRLAGEFLGALKEAPPADGAYFSFHGSMVAEGEEDPEGYLLAEARKILGEKIPIVLSLDLHGIVTRRMLELSDAAVLYHTYPHVDLGETGQRAARVLLRILTEGAQPVTALVEIPALVRGDELVTETGLYGKMLQGARDFERRPGGLAAGIFIGNPFTDVPGLRSGSLVVTDNDPRAAEREALNLAEFFWVVHERLQAPLVPLKDAVRLAHEAEGPLLLFDAADAPSSGASGDGNAILKELLAQGFGKPALVPIVDAPAARAAQQAGIGKMLRVAVGGTRDPGRFQPIELDARVKTLSDGKFPFERDYGSADAGPTAVLESGPITLVVFSGPLSIHDRSPFYVHGLDPARFHVTVAKCPHWHRRYMDGWVKEIVNVDAPGSTSANLRSLGHTRCPRPIFPLDANVVFEPRVSLIRRAR
ncbi:MAG: M81 family metallopeptidase [Planctomycetota bacterium]|nr:M81 family metallopeptidase [Planctomycetota bacterium]